jgi:hypothetical protein
MTTENDMQEALMKLLDERAATYGALRQSSLTAIALDRAAQALTATRAELAASAARVQALEGALRDALEFVERHSSRWDWVEGKHPLVIAEAARAALMEQPK